MLLIKAEKDLVLAKMALEKYNDDYMLDMACYHLQQSVEKCLKFILEMKGYPYPFTHDIDKLLQGLDKVGIGVPSRERLDLLAGTLTLWESKSRYYEEFSANIRIVKEVITICDNLLGFAKEDSFYKDMDVF